MVREGQIYEDLLHFKGSLFIIVGSSFLDYNLGKIITAVGIDNTPSKNMILTEENEVKYKENWRFIKDTNKRCEKCQK